MLILIGNIINLVYIVLSLTLFYQKTLYPFSMLLKDKNPTVSFISYKHEVIVYVIFLTLVAAVQYIIIPVLEWVAFFKVGTIKEKGWKKFIFIMGILTLIIGLFRFQNILVFILNIVVGVLFILSFYVKNDSKEKMKTK